MDPAQPNVRSFDRRSGGGWFGNAAETAKVNVEKPENAYSKVRGSATGLLQDAIRLADLQFQLLLVDAADFWHRAKLGLAGAAISVVVLLCATILLLFGIAEFIQLQSGLDAYLAKAIVAGSFLIIASIVGWLSIRWLTKAGNVLKRSASELQENLNWLRSVVNQDDN